MRSVSRRRREEFIAIPGSDRHFREVLCPDYVGSDGISRALLGIADTQNKILIARKQSGHQHLYYGFLDSVANQSLKFARLFPLVFF